MRSFTYYTNSGSSTSGHYVEVREDRLMELIKVVLEHIEVDENWYLATYRDVDAAVEAGVVSSATEHYKNAGYFENRLPRAIPVDERWYLREYADVAEAVQHGSFSSATQHFEKEGFKEGRLPRYKWSLIFMPASRRAEVNNVASPAADAGAF